LDEFRSLFLLAGHIQGKNLRPQEAEDHNTDDLLPYVFSLYVNIFTGPLDKGPEQEETYSINLPGKDYFLHTARPIKRDRASLAAFLGISTIGGPLLRAPEYKDPIPPGVAERQGNYAYVVRWIGLG
jgi:hypothetical protein